MGTLGELGWEELVAVQEYGGGRGREEIQGGVG